MSNAHKVPAWILAPYEEREVRERCQEQANQKCAKFFMEFGKCSEQHQLLFSWKCAQQKKSMIDCVAFWGSEEVYETLQYEYIEEKKEKLRAEGRL